jgi:hypothetical protein
MDTRRQPILRIPIILLALIDLGLLGARLWPWQEVMNLPGGGTTGVDPAISLVGYVGLGFWIGTARQDDSRKSLFSAAWLGIVAGLLLVAQVVIATRQAAADPAAGMDRVQIGLIAGAALIIGIVGLRTAKSGFPLGFSSVCAIWASMVACLMGVAAVLGEAYLGAGMGESSDPWKAYQRLAIGTPAIQSMVHSLDTISGFLLIGPLIGCIAGAIFASFGKPKKA